MRRLILLVAVALVMAMVLAGPAHANGISQNVGGGIGNSIGNFDSSNGFSNTDSLILVGNGAFFTTGFGDFDVDSGGVNGVDVDFD